MQANCRKQRVAASRDFADFCRRRVFPGSGCDAARLDAEIGHDVARAWFMQGT